MKAFPLLLALLVAALPTASSASAENPLLVCLDACDEDCPLVLCDGPEPTGCRPYCIFGDKESCDHPLCALLPGLIGPPGQGCRPLCEEQECDLFCSLDLPPPGPPCRPHCMQEDCTPLCAILPGWQGPPGQGCRPACEESGCDLPVCPSLDEMMPPCRPNCFTEQESCVGAVCIPGTGVGPDPGSSCRPMCLGPESDESCDLLCPLGLPVGPPGPSCKPHCFTGQEDCEPLCGVPLPIAAPGNPCRPNCLTDQEDCEPAAVCALIPGLLGPPGQGCRPACLTDDEGCRPFCLPGPLGDDPGTSPCRPACLPVEDQERADGTAHAARATVFALLA